jgi:flagellar protein FlaG
MDISDKSSLVALQASRPKLEAKANSESLPKVVSGTNVAEPVAVDPSAAVAEQREKLEQQLETAVSRINEYVQSVQRTLEFTVDEESGKDVVRIIDKQTEEVVRQLPSDEVLAMARNIAEFNEDNISLFTSKV